MVGGGPGAFIGEVHRIGCTFRQLLRTCRGSAFVESGEGRSYAAELGIQTVYSSFEEMAAAEAKHPERIDAVAIVTPNDTHYTIAKDF